MWMMQGRIQREGQKWGMKSVLMVMGEEDQSVGPLLEQTDYVRQFLPKGARLESKEIKNAAHGLCGEEEKVLKEVAQLIWDHY
mmetsp:Transcript_37993/g.88395  ORF Transcript_37993/g.88395 Transcript_37993/m.88395 type:complete len:83 (-) Transcript_37993:183-431(-)